MTWKDVWSRSDPKYRVRAILLLAVNVLLFAGVGAFGFWIRSGTAFAPTMDGYWDQMLETFRFTGEGGVSLGSMLLEPISVQTVPMQIPILGLLIATLIGIPILVSILYRFWCSLPFIAVVGFLAVMPWLAITLLGSCMIASLRPFRTPFRFMSALLGLSPALLYLVLASAGTEELVAGRIDPADAIKFAAPWLLAVVAAALLFAVVLEIAKLVDYRTGAITPLLAIMFGAPLVLFEFYVGRDELHYRLLEALSAAHFEEVDSRADLTEAVDRAWERHPLPRPRRRAVYEVEAQKWQLALAADIEPFRWELARNQAELVERCDRFQREFPQSPYIFNVLYLKARALDLRIDTPEFRRTGWIRFYDDFPNVRSRLTWGILAENQIDEGLRAAALLRLAQFDAREGEFDRAELRLVSMVNSAGEGTAHVVNASRSSSLNIPISKIRLEARRTLDLMIHNREPGSRDEPLAGPRRSTESLWFGYFDLDPRDGHYSQNLELLKHRHANSKLVDNLELEIAKAGPSPEVRIERLKACAGAYPSGDAAAETLFRLAAAFKSSGRSEQCDAVLEKLRREQPSSVWSQQSWKLAGQLLRLPKANT